MRPVVDVASRGPARAVSWPTNESRAAALLERGLIIPVLFTGLPEERPHRHDEIERVAALWCGTAPGSIIDVTDRGTGAASLSTEGFGWPIFVTMIGLLVYWILHEDRTCAAAPRRWLLEDHPRQ